jgi:anhydro-N-acetylmuramic acid kinase
VKIIFKKTPEKPILKNLQEYKVIGLMSGTSLDGVDLVFCRFILSSGRRWSFDILKAETIEYNAEWRNRLQNLHHSDAMTFVKTHVELGKYFGKLIKNFIKKHRLKPKLICSHGHTVFHQPENGFTSQAGDGAQIAAITDIETVCDFRTKDVAHGGQGAPLVPVGDLLLFPGYDFCLNLGGIANISFKQNKNRIAFDICPVNMALNRLASEAKLNFDKNGELAAKGKISHLLLDQLNALDFYGKPPPKSLGREWYLANCESLISDTSIPLNDRLRTFCEHIGVQIANAPGFKTKPGKRMLVTGGGAHNKFLVYCIENCLRKKSGLNKISVEVPPKEIVDFKEALIFAFLGTLRIRNEINVFSSVTGANKNSIGGAIYAAG